MTRQSAFKLEEDRFGLDIRKKFFTVRVVRPWHGLPREAVGAPSPEALKARLDGALSSVTCWVATCPWQGVGTGWALMSLPTQTIPRYDVFSLT